MRRRVLASWLLLAAAPSALAQDASDDWEVIRQPEEKAIFAFVPMTSGLTIGFRCVDGAFGAVIAGLPPAPPTQPTRPLQLTIRGTPSPMGWNVTTDPTVAMADYPAPLARRLRPGGAISIVVPGGAEDGRNLRHNLVLPASSAAIDETLAACDRPLDDPRDGLVPEIQANGLPAGVTWSRPPRPRFPNTFYREGYAVLSCVVQPEGQVDQCQVESEFPLDGGFGRNALRGVSDARLVSPGETPGQYAPRMIAFRVQYRMR